MRDVTVELKALRLHGMASAWCDLAEQGAASGLDASRWLVEHLLQAETTDRSMRSVQHQMNSARFPVHRDLAGFDFDASAVDQKLVHQLATLEFTEAAHNVVLVGGPGTGKTHLATALGVSGIVRHSKRVRFYSTVDLVNALEQEKAQGKAGRIALSLLRMDLVILDELGYLPCAVVPPAVQAVRAHQRGDHHQLGLRRMVDGVRRREDDDRLARPPHAPLPHRGDGQREPSVPAQQRYGEEAHQGQEQTRKAGAKADPTDATG